jgi:hypothetical protein
VLTFVHETRHYFGAFLVMLAACSKTNDANKPGQQEFAGDVSNTPGNLSTSTQRI